MKLALVAHLARARVVHQDVVRLDVEVDHPLRVHVRERAGNVERAADPEVAGGAAARSTAKEKQAELFGNLNAIGSKKRRIHWLKILGKTTMLQRRF
jgi:hypothetical protein